MNEPAGGVYLFCVTPAGDAGPGASLAAFADHPVGILSLPPLHLWIQPLPQAPTRSQASVLVHHRVVHAAWRSASSVAPMRFGQWFRDREALLAAVRPRIEALTGALERLRGTGENAVRLVGPEGETAPHPASEGGTAPEGAGPGRTHLETLALRERARRAREAEARELAGALAAAVGPWTLDERVEPLEAGGLVSVAHLVRRSDEAGYAAAVDAFASAHPALRVVRGGPWPPYSFVP